MAEIDPVILQLRAEVNGYLAQVRNATRTVDQQLGQQERRVKKLETEFRSSSGAIGGAIKGLAATLATAFTGRELVGLIDSYTRLQNQLRISGLEGAKLAEIQGNLLDLSGRYGVSIEELANLYGKSAQAAAELGASEEQLLQITQNSAAALKITGTTAAQAQGALLGLTQALSSGTVRAEEFNQINEGGLRPLLQAAANTDRFKGSVAALRNAVVEGEVSSQEFYQSILAGSADLESKAANATLTLSGAVTALTSALTVYVGEAANANGVTGALAAGIQTLAENLDTIIPILATIAVFMGVRLVASAVAAQGALAGTAAQMGVVGAASFAMQARIAGAATSMQALAFAGRGATAALGGPLGLAITALAAGFAYMSFEASKARAETERLTQAADDAVKTAETYRQRLQDAGVAVDGIGNASNAAARKVDNLADAMRNAAADALDLIDKLRLTNFLEASNALARNQREQRERAEDLQSFSTVAGNVVRSSFGNSTSVINNTVEGARQLIELRREETALVDQLRSISAGIVNGVDVTAAPTSTAPRPTPTRSKGGGSAGRTTVTDPAETRRRFDDQLDAIRARVAAAETSLATSIEERAELELRQVEAALRQSLRSLEAEEEYTDAQRERLRVGLENVAAAERAVIEFEKQAEIEQRNRDLAEDRGRAQLDGLRLQFQLADTEGERRVLAMQILEAEQELLRSRLSSLASSETIDQADRERARIALEALNANAASERELTVRQNEGALARFARGTQDADARVEEAAVRRIERLNETITDAMTNALGIEDPFLRDLIGIFLDKNVFGPLAEALSSQQGGGGLAGIVTAIGSLFGRSSGGPVTAGRAYRVNEGASPGRVEAFVPNTGGQIIPLGRMNAMQSGVQQSGGVVRVVIEEGPGFAARVRTEATGVALEVTRQTAPAIVDAAASETLRRAQRPSL